MTRIGFWCALVLSASMAITAANAGILNGDFSNGKTGFSSMYAYVPATHNVGAGSCWPEGVYAIVSSPNQCHSLWGSFAPQGTATKMIVVNGAVKPGLSFWSETTHVQQNGSYDFSLWAASAYHDNPADLELEINGTAVATMVLSSIVGNWTEFTAKWNSGIATSASLTLYDLNTIALGNDFAIDNVSFVDPNVPEPWTASLFGFGIACIGFAFGVRKGTGRICIGS